MSRTPGGHDGEPQVTKTRAGTIKVVPTPVFDLAVTQAVCDVLGQTGYPGLTGSELRAALEHVRVLDLPEAPNKRTALRVALHNTQVERRSGGPLVTFINAAMRPALYVTDHARWETLRGQLDEVLVLYGLHVNDSGQLSRRARAARTLSEAAELAGTLQSELRRRGCHEQLFGYCREELVAKSLFHATSEAAKSIPDRIRSLTGCPLDGASLYDEVFGTKTGAPVLTINALATPSEESEHKGFKNLLVGIHGHYRNPRAHATRLGASEDAADFYDAFALFSYVHRRLDRATRSMTPA